jgi:predicted RNA-binding Zn-ribbon protein involved in translation (DUF1610 family)
MTTSARWGHATAPTSAPVPTTAPHRVTRHTPSCTRPGWILAPSQSMPGVTLARCDGCGAVEIRRATT